MKIYSSSNGSGKIEFVFYGPYYDKNDNLLGHTSSEYHTFANNKTRAQYNIQHRITKEIGAMEHVRIDYDKVKQASKRVLPPSEEQYIDKNFLMGKENKPVSYQLVVLRALYAFKYEETGVSFEDWLEANFEKRDK